MMAFVALAALIALGLAASLWAAGGQSVYATPGSGIIETVPGAVENSPPPPAGQLIILSYALAYGAPPPVGDAAPDAAAVCDRLDSVIETIAACGAEIVLLQEVDFASARTCDIDQLGYIAAALGWGYAARAVTWECRYAPWPWRRPSGRIRAGLGVISRYPLTQHVRHHLPHAHAGLLWVARWFPRHAAQMVDAQCGGATLRLLNTHLAPPRSAVRQRQMGRLADLVHRMRTPSCILMGRLHGAAQDKALDGLTREPPNPLHVVAAPSDAETPPEAILLGRALQAHDVRLIDVEAPLSDALPLALRLRWELPLMRVLG